jgi:PAS domain S-box-containing protein
MQNSPHKVESQIPETNPPGREKELRDFIENVAVPLHWVGENGTILWANNAELCLLGYSREEYVGHDIREFHVD